MDYFRRANSYAAQKLVYDISSSCKFLPQLFFAGFRPFTTAHLTSSFLLIILYPKWSIEDWHSYPNLNWRKNYSAKISPSSAQLWSSERILRWGKGSLRWWRMRMTDLRSWTERGRRRRSQTTWKFNRLSNGSNSCWWWEHILLLLSFTARRFMTYTFDY